jgi:hypothetical protein
MKMLTMILTGFCAIAYAVQWYLGAQIPAWQALIWVSVVFINDLNEYLESRV